MWYTKLGDVTIGPVFCVLGEQVLVTVQYNKTIASR
jgi:hypothetical protein